MAAGLGDGPGPGAARSLDLRRDRPEEQLISPSAALVQTTVLRSQTWTRTDRVTSEYPATQRIGAAILRLLA